MTEMAKDAATNPETAAFIAGLHALKRMAQPQEIANAALFLLSDLSSFVTGSAMLADGEIPLQRSEEAAFQPLARRPRPVGTGRGAAVS